MAIPAGSVVWRSYSFKRFGVPPESRTYCNRHDYLIPDASTPAMFANQFNHQTVAEQHLLHREVTMVTRVGVPLTADNAPGLEFRAYAEFNTVFGGMSGWQASPAIQWPNVLVLRKFPTHGRSGKYMFVGGLRQIDCRVDEAGRIAIVGGFNAPQLALNGFNAYMQQGVFDPYYAPSYPGNYLPETAVRILNFGQMQAMRLTTSPDAQERKTAAGASYKRLCEDWLVALAAWGLEWKRLARSVGPNVPKVWIQSWRTLFASLVAGWSQVMQYYEAGQEPEVIFNWRPGAGLDPYKEEAQTLGQAMLDVAEEFAFEIEQMMQYPATYVPQLQLQALEYRTWQVAGLYAWFVERERFTGVPVRGNIV